MTSNDFRRVALSLPAAVEAEHMGHPDFRVGGKIFASLGYPGDGWGTVKLSPSDQETFVRSAPDVFTRVKGAWGRAGATSVHLESVNSRSLRKALTAAWNFTVPTAVRAGKVERTRMHLKPGGHRRA